MNRLFLVFIFAVGLVPAGLAQSPASPNEGSWLSRDPLTGIYSLYWKGRAENTYFIQHSEDLIQWRYFPLVRPGANVILGENFETNAEKFFVRLQLSDMPTGDPFNADFDGDGVSNLNEVAQGTDPLRNVDTDGDGMPDDWELAHGFNSTDGSEGALDSDGDGFANAAEFAAGTDPSKLDSDDDGLTDEQERLEGTLPNNPDTDGDEIPDGEDGWPLEPLIKTPRLPLTRYAVMVRATGNGIEPLALGNSGDVVFSDPSDAQILHYLPLDVETPHDIVNTWWPANAPFGGAPSVIGISDDHTVFGSWWRMDTGDPAKPHWNFRWTPGTSPGSPTIEYTGDGFTLPPSFTADPTITGSSADSGWYGSFVTRAGTVHGSGFSTRYDYDSGRYVKVWSPGLNREAISDYAPSAYMAAMEYIDLPFPPNLSGGLEWPGALRLVNNNGDLLYHYEGLDVSGEAPGKPSPPEGDYLAPNLTIALPLDECIAMNDAKHVLGWFGLFVWDSTAPATQSAWSPITTPRIHDAVTPGPMTALWSAFNNRLEAIGTLYPVAPNDAPPEPVVLLNDHDYLLHHYLPQEWRIDSLAAINDSGMILAKARQVLDDTGAAITPAAQVTSVAVLLPIEFTTTDIGKGFDYPLDGDPPPLVGDPPFGGGGYDYLYPEWWTSVGQHRLPATDLHLNTHVVADVGSQEAADALSIRVRLGDESKIDFAPTELAGKETPLQIIGKVLPTVLPQRVEIEIVTKGANPTPICNLSVAVLAEVEIPVQIYFVYDGSHGNSPASNSTFVRPQFQTAGAIVDHLNKVFRQACVRFYLGS